MSRVVFKLPDLGEGTTQSEVVAWHAEIGDVVQEDAPLVEMSTDKAVVEVPSPVTGRVVARAGNAGATVAVGAELVIFEVLDTVRVPDAVASTPTSEPNVAQPPSAPQAFAVLTTAESPRPKGEARRVMASPATRRRAAEYGVSLSGVTGTGPQGRIQRGDLEAHVRGRSLPTESGSPTQEIAITGVRRIIAQRMSEAKRNIPHFTYVEEVDMTALTALRDHLRSTPQYAGLTFLPFVVVALTRVLADFPQCNALYDADRAVVVRHRAVHVGIATQTRDGLKVPVLRDASGKGLIDIAQQIKQITEAARDNKLKATQMQGSTITITSLGKLAGVVFTPIINPPEVAIVGLNKIMQRPVVVNGSLAIRSMMNLSSSFDHRFVDGFDAASMIAALKERLENPATLFF